MPKKQKKTITSFVKRQSCLPHWQKPGSAYFITFKTHNERELSHEEKNIALGSLKYWDNQRWLIHAAVIMANYVHAVVSPLEKENGSWWDLSIVLHSVKSFSANAMNKAVKRVGESVWQSETYDRIIRDEADFFDTLQYIAHNPVKAGLVEECFDYEWFYLRDDGWLDVTPTGWKPAPRGVIPTRSRPGWLEAIPTSK